MRAIRVVVAGGQTLIVWMVWVREMIPRGPLSVPAVMVALVLVGAVAGVVALAISGGRRPVTYIVAALTLVVLVGNITIGVAAEPMWFKLLVATLLVPMILIGGQRAVRPSHTETPLMSLPESGRVVAPACAFWCRPPAREPWRSDNPSSLGAAVVDPGSSVAQRAQFPCRSAFKKECIWPAYPGEFAHADLPYRH